jgi:hypothetical protein
VHEVAHAPLDGRKVRRLRALLRELARRGQRKVLLLDGVEPLLRLRLRRRARAPSVEAPLRRHDVAAGEGVAVERVAVAARVLVVVVAAVVVVVAVAVAVPVLVVRVEQGLARAAAAAALAAAVGRRLDDAQGLLFSSDDRSANVRVDAALLSDLAAAASIEPPLLLGAAASRPAGVAAPGAPAYRSKPCRNFAAGSCRFGDACAFRH